MPPDMTDPTAETQYWATAVDNLRALESSMTAPSLFDES